MALQKHKLEMRRRESQERYLAVVEQFQEVKEYIQTDSGT